MNTETPDTKRAKFDSEKIRRAINTLYDEESQSDDGFNLPRSSFETARVYEKGKTAGQPFAGVPGGTGRLPASLDVDVQNREYLLRELDKRIFSHVSRLVYCIFLLVLLVWIETAALLGWALPPYISVSANVFGFVAADSVLLLLTGLICVIPMLKGAAALFTFRPDSRSLVFVAFLGAAVNDIYLLFNSGSFVKGGTMIYSAAAAAVITFSLWGRTASLKRAKKGLLSLAKSGDFYSVKKLDIPGGLAQAEGAGEETQALYPVKTSLEGDYLKDAFAITPPDRVARVLSPAILIAALAILIVNLFLKHGYYNSTASFAAVCCIGAPVMFELGAALPFLRVSRRLFKRKALLTGCGTINDIAGIDSMVADDIMIFPPETVAVHAIKTFSDVKIEKAVLDAASVANAVGGPLSQALKGLIGEDSRETLEKVTDIKFKDDLGISATIDRQTVLFGSRDLMRTNGIEIPSREYEAKYAAQGRDIFYLASAGRLYAMFVAGYYSNNEILTSLKWLGNSGISLFLRTSDVNITPSLIAERLNEDHSSVRILDSYEVKRLAILSGDKASTGLAFSGSIRSYAEAVIAGLKLKQTMEAATAVQIVAAAFGVGIVAWCSLMSGINILTPVALLEYQGIWAVPVLLIALFAKN